MSHSITVFPEVFFICNPCLIRDDYIVHGRPQDLGGGGQEYFFSDLGICMSRSDMLRMAKPCALLGGFGGMLPQENFLNGAIWCVLGCTLIRFCLDFFFKNYHFLYKK